MEYVKKLREIAALQRQIKFLEAWNEDEFFEEVLANVEKAAQNGERRKELRWLLPKRTVKADTWGFTPEVYPVQLNEYQMRVLRAKLQAVGLAVYQQEEQSFLGFGGGATVWVEW